MVEGTSPTKFDANTGKVLLDGDYAFLDPTFFKDTDGKMFLFFKVARPVWHRLGDQGPPPGGPEELSGTIMAAPCC